MHCLIRDLLSGSKFQDWHDVYRPRLYCHFFHNSFVYFQLKQRYRQKITRCKGFLREAFRAILNSKAVYSSVHPFAQMGQNLSLKPTQPGKYE